MLFYYVNSYCACILVFCFCSCLAYILRNELNITLDKANLVRIRSPDKDPDTWSWLRINGDILSKSYICRKKFSLSKDMRHVVDKCNFFKKNSGFGSGCGWLPEVNQFFFVHRYICGKIFMKIRVVVFYVKLLTDRDRQTNKQTKRRALIHNLLGGGNNLCLPFLTSINWS